MIARFAAFACHSVCIAWLLCGGLWANQLHAGPFDAEWKEVEDALAKGLPKTALEKLPPIRANALRGQAWGELARAVAQQCELEAAIQGGKPEERIRRLQAELKIAPKEIQPILNPLLAIWEWQYFQVNRWRILERTQTSEPLGDDFTTWPLARLFAEIDRAFTASLADAPTLKRTPVQTFDGILRPGTLPDDLRPTLYDFVVHQALQFYSSGEQAGAKPEDSIDLVAGEPVYGVIPLFGSPQEFATAGKIERRASESAAEKALFLYRDLTLFHLGDKDPRALVDLTLHRLRWARRVSVGESVTPLYRKALSQLANQYRRLELSAQVDHALAEDLISEELFSEAFAVAKRGRDAYPESVGGKECDNLIKTLLLPSLQIQAERAWDGRTNSASPLIHVRYKNVTNVWFRAIPYNWETYITDPQRNQTRDQQALLKKPALLEWSYPLAPTPDYKVRAQSLSAPQGMKPGFYLILASPDRTFSPSQGPLQMTPVWVSSLALVSVQRSQRLEGFVLDAESGEPIPGAVVTAWSESPNVGTPQPGAKVMTDALGFYQFPPTTKPRSYFLHASNCRESVSTEQPQYLFPEPGSQPLQPVYLFTDRSIYRPGQAIRYKGLGVSVDPDRNDYRVTVGRKVTVLLRDPNGRELGRAVHTCNAMGSFQGSFTAPTSGLLGQMTLSPEGNFGQVTVVHVEEYKRPTFQVELPAPTTAHRLNDTVEVSGSAIAYNGTPIQGATVRWRVEREVRFPEFGLFAFGRNFRHSPQQELAHGSTTTSAEGRFKLQFVAKPDASIPEKENPTFSYRVFADVTDPAGETRSTTAMIRIGYSALELSVNVDAWQTTETPVLLKLTSQSLDGTPQVSQGRVLIQGLVQPTRIPRTGLDTQSFVDASNEGEDPRQQLDPERWPAGPQVASIPFSCGTNGVAELKTSLAAGIYRATATTKDRYGKEIQIKRLIEVLNPSSARCPIKKPFLFKSPERPWEPGESFRALWGTGYDQGRAFVEIEVQRQIIQRFWTQPGRTQQEIVLAITEAMRGGVTVHLTQVRENRAYLESTLVDVPWSNKEIELRWEHFTSKLEPGAKETWTLVATPKKGTEGTNFSGEMVATLYDRSLDAFASHYWPGLQGLFRQNNSSRSAMFANGNVVLEHLAGDWTRDAYWEMNLSYRDYLEGLTAAGGYFRRAGRGIALGQVPLFKKSSRPLAETSSRPRWGTALPAAPLPEPALAADAAAPGIGGATRFDNSSPQDVGGSPNRPGQPSAISNPPAPQPRRNLSETALFLPQLLSDTNGAFRFSFTMPEALTEWRFMGLAHDARLRSGMIEAKTVTSKDLMVQPNPPRFLREGDVLEFTARVINQSSTLQSGKVSLHFQLAMNDQSADEQLGLRSPELRFSLPAHESHTFSWRIRVPDGLGFLKYKVVASSATLSDGEENYLPVLSRRVFLTESLPLPIRGPATRTFQFSSLQNSANSKSLVHQGLTVQMVSQPAWYAVLALPYLMEYPHECSEQTFNRYYANNLARHIATSDPKIQSVFQRWKNTPALASPMEKNQDLKSVLIEETPWLRASTKESESRRQIATLFDADRLAAETGAVLTKLTQMQLGDGRWPWFPGGLGNDYLTLYIATGFGRLRHLGVNVPIELPLRAWSRLDLWIIEQQKLAQKQTGPRKGFDSSIALYLYGRSFFLTERPPVAKTREAIDFWLSEARAHWVESGWRQTQGHLALALKRFGDSGSAIAILNSLRERSVTDPEMGMFWRDTELGWWWYQAPVETQALMIEAFDEIGGDLAAVDGCKTWLLKQKQTQNWKTTKGTGDAVYALLLRGASGLTSDALVQVDLGGSTIPTDKAEAGTGFYQHRVAGADVTAALGNITVRKSDPGIAWGAVHWQYLEDLSQVKPHTGTPLQLKKRLFLKKNSTTGPILSPVKEGTAVGVGDELVVRIELKADRDMEYVHLKDLRGSGTEPVDVLSGYRFQDGLSYYASNKDTASHFFIDYLRKGTYVFEYSSRVQQRGEYQTGVAEIQCLYAPEFNSHSESVKLSVQ